MRFESIINRFFFQKRDNSHVELIKETQEGLLSVINLLDLDELSNAKMETSKLDIAIIAALFHIEMQLLHNLVEGRDTTSDMDTVERI